MGVLYICNKAGTCPHVINRVHAISCIHERPHEHRNACDGQCKKNVHAKCVVVVV